MKKLNRKSGEVLTIALCAFAGIMLFNFGRTVVDGTLKNQIQRIKNAHNGQLEGQKN